MERLELGLTPVALDAHFVLAGWTSRTLAILEEIMVSQARVERFLRKRGVRRLRVALLAERVDARLREEIKLQLGKNWSARQIILRSGSPLRLDDLERVDFAHAGSILIPAADTTASSNLDADSRTVKTLMTMAAELEEAPPEELPLVVVEIQDTQHVDMLHALYQGPMEIIAGDEVINRLTVQSVRHPGLSHVYAEFLSDTSGSQIYVREASQLTGASIPGVGLRLSQRHTSRPGATPGRRLTRRCSIRPMICNWNAGDHVVVLASSYEDAAPPATVSPVAELPERAAPRAEMPAKRRVLVLGWNHRVPALVGEFASHPSEQFAIDIVSQVSAY